MQTVILLGDTEDPHIGSVAKHLEQLQQDFVVVGMGGNFGLVAVEIARGEPCLRLADRSFTPAEIASVWDRARSSMPILEKESWQYIFRERKALLEGLAAFAPSARWMNPLHTSVLASNKIAQLLAAMAEGLRVPQTIITNDPATARELAEQTEWALVFKALSWVATMKGEVLFTTELSPAMMGDLEVGLRPAPCIFQKKIEKEYELRVAVVGEELFPARIESQASESARLDWRRDQLNLSYCRHPIPKEVEVSLLAIMRRLGLTFGAFDLCKSSDGDWVFFEVNPAGNWLWIEEMAGLPISASVARWLSATYV